MQSGGSQSGGSSVGLTARRILRVQARFWGRAWRRLGGLFGLLLVLGLLEQGGYTPTALFGPWEHEVPLWGRAQAVTAALGLLLLLFKLGERLMRRTAPVAAWRRFLVE